MSTATLPDVDLLDELLHGEGPACDWVGHAWDDGPTCSGTVTHRMVQTCNGVGFLGCANAVTWVRWVVGRSRMGARPIACVGCNRDVHRCWHLAPV